MPWAPLRTCPTHRLRLPVGTRCPACVREYDRTRPSTHYAVLNSHAWRLLRRQVLNEEPWCACGCGRPSTQVDHIVSRVERPDLTFVRANLRGMAAECHGRKTRADGREAGR